MEGNNEGQFLCLNFIIDHASLDFVGYEFKGEEIYLDEIECEQSLFRMDIDKKTGDIVVYSAYSQDFDVMEEVTYYFDTKKLYSDILKYIENNEVGNQGEFYVRYVKFREEGYDCEDAISKAYDI